MLIPVSILSFTFGQVKLWSNKLSSSKSHWICLLCSFNLPADVQPGMMEQFGNICRVGNTARTIPEALSLEQGWANPVLEGWYKLGFVSYQAESMNWNPR